MDKNLIFVRICCGGCGSSFYVCERDYRGQVYCDTGCRQGAMRAAKARHQGSRSGRLDHAARNVVYRIRLAAVERATKIVTDTRSNNLPGEASSCVGVDASFSAVEEHVVAAESTDDGTDTMDNAAAVTRDAEARDGAQIRSDPASLGCTDGESAALRDEACGGALRARSDEICCVVCGRRGQFIRDAEVRPVRPPRGRSNGRGRRRRTRVARPPSGPPRP